MSNNAEQRRLAAALDVERDALFALLPQFSDEQWRNAARDDGWTAHDIANHLADATYGLSLALLGEGTLPIDQQTGQIAPNESNEQRRQKNRDLPREKIISRMTNAFASARRAVDTVDDYDADAPLGFKATKGQMLQRIIDHSASHRNELAALLTETEQG